MVDLVDWSPSFGLTEAQALVVLGEIDAAVDGWRHRAALARIDPCEIALMVPAFDNPARREAKAIMAASGAGPS